MKVAIAGRQWSIGGGVSSAGALIGLVALSLPWVQSLRCGESLSLYCSSEQSGWEAIWTQWGNFHFGLPLALVLLVILANCVLWMANPGHVDRLRLKFVPGEVVIGLLGLLPVAVGAYSVSWYDSLAGAGAWLEVAAGAAIVAGAGIGLVPDIRGRVAAAS